MNAMYVAVFVCVALSWANAAPSGLLTTGLIGAPGIPATGLIATAPATKIIGVGPTLIGTSAIDNGLPLGLGLTTGLGPAIATPLIATPLAATSISSGSIVSSGAVLSKGSLIASPGLITKTIW